MFFRFLVLLFLAFNLTACSFSFGTDKNGVNSEVSSDFINYDQDTRFAIAYPKDWQYNDLTGLQADYDFFVVEGITDANDKFRENLNLIVDNSATAISKNLDEYFQENKDALSEYIDNLSDIQTEEGEINGSPYKMLSYSGKIKSQYIPEDSFQASDLLWIQYIFNDDNSNIKYILTFTIEKDKLDSYKDIIKEIVNSFKIKK